MYFDPCNLACTQYLLSFVHVTSINYFPRKCVIIQVYVYFTDLDIESQIRKFEIKFKGLNIEARKELEEKYNSRCVEVLKDDLTFLPSSIVKEHHKYVTQIIDQKQPFTNLTHFFKHLNLYCWNFFEYKVLQSLIECNCSEELKERMSKYANDIEGFRQRTTITEFIKCGRHLVKKTDIPPYFKKITLECDIDPDLCTLAELDHFRIDTYEALDLKLSECAFQVYRIKHGCVVVKWMVSEEFTKPLKDLFNSKTGQYLLQKHSVEKLLIDKTEIPIQSVCIYLHAVLLIMLNYISSYCLLLLRVEISVKSSHS